MSDENLVSIPVTLAGRNYPVLVQPIEVENVKRVNQQLQDDFSALHARYAYKLNKKNILAMLLIT